MITLENIILLAKEYRLDLKCLVLDKGFYSQSNLKSLEQKGFSYIIPMSFNTSLSKRLIGSVSKELSSASSFFTFCDNIYWYCKRDVKIGSVNCIAHIYLDKVRRSQQETLFLSKISQFEEIFLKNKIQSKSECEKYVSETLKSWKSFFIINEGKKGFFLERNVVNIEKEIERMGSIILLTREKQRYYGMRFYICIEIKTV